MDSEIFLNPELWKLWTLCLMLANHKEKHVHVEGLMKLVKVKPGQFITGRYKLHKLYYPKIGKNQKSPYTLWRWMKILQQLENMSIKTCNKYSIITIRKWSTYQNSKNTI